MGDPGPPRAADRSDGRSDEALLRAFTMGERAALGELARRYERTLLGFARGVLGSEDLACEAVQEAWVRVIRHAGTFKGRSSFKTWMYRIVINRCNDIREDIRRSRPVAVVGAAREAMNDGARAEALEVNGTLRRLVDGLEERKRLTVLLCYHDGITHEIAAEILQVPVGTVKSRLNAALRELRGRIEEAV